MSSVPQTQLLQIMCEQMIHRKFKEQHVATQEVHMSQELTRKIATSNKPKV
jgi:hypothetical protein